MPEAGQGGGTAGFNGGGAHLHVTLLQTRGLLRGHLILPRGLQLLQAFQPRFHRGDVGSLGVQRVGLLDEACVLTVSVRRRRCSFRTCGSGRWAGPVGKPARGWVGPVGWARV